MSVWYAKWSLTRYLKFCKDNVQILLTNLCFVKILIVSNWCTRRKPKTFNINTTSITLVSMFNVTRFIFWFSTKVEKYIHTFHLLVFKMLSEYQNSSVTSSKQRDRNCLFYGFLLNFEELRWKSAGSVRHLFLARIIFEILKAANL